MSFMNTAEITSATLHLAQRFPQRCRLLSLPHPTAEGRQSTALWLGNGAAGTKDAVIVLAGIHARENGPCDIAIELATNLLRADDGQLGLAFGQREFGPTFIRDLLDRLHIVVFPLVNPDGRVHCETTGEVAWRKNRNPAMADPSNSDSIGVDINRNFDFLFDFRRCFAPGGALQVSEHPSDFGIYQGPHPFSEAEARNVKWLLDQFVRARCLVDLHTAGRTVQYPWGDDEMQPDDPAQSFLSPAGDGLRGLAGDAYAEYIDAGDAAAMKALAGVLAAGIEAVAGTVYDVLPAYDGFTAAPGTSHDYAYSRHLVNPSLGKVYGFYVECGDAQTEQSDEEDEAMIKEVTAGLIGFCDAVRKLPPAQ